MSNGKLPNLAVLVALASTLNGITFRYSPFFFLPFFLFLDWVEQSAGQPPLSLVQWTAKRAGLHMENVFNEGARSLYLQGTAEVSYPVSNWCSCINIKQTVSALSGP